MTSNQNTNKDVSIVLTTLKDIAEAVMYAAEAGTLEKVLQRIAEVSKDVVRARYAALGVPDGKGGLRYFKTAGISDEEIARIPHPPKGRGLLGVIMRDRETLRLANMGLDSRSVGFPENHPRMTSLLGVPIQTSQQLFGMLYLSDKLDGEPFDEEDQTLVETFAGYAALAIAGVQLSEQQSRLTLLEERERFSMELHDGIIQSLYAIGMRLQIMRLSKATPDADLIQTIANLDTVIEDIRQYILNLKTIDYQHRSIKDCLRDVLDRLHIPATLTIRINAADDPPALTPTAMEGLCKIAYEALSNAIRHAQAKSITITAEQNDTQFILIIRDDGIGFDPNNIDSAAGFGVRNIHQRARIHNGQVQYITSPGGGTQVIVTVPVTEQNPLNSL